MKETLCPLNLTETLFCFMLEPLTTICVDPEVLSGMTSRFQSHLLIVRVSID